MKKAEVPDNPSKTAICGVDTYQLERLEEKSFEVYVDTKHTFIKRRGHCLAMTETSLDLNPDNRTKRNQLLTSIPRVKLPLTERVFYFDYQKLTI